MGDVSCARDSSNPPRSRSHLSIRLWAKNPCVSFKPSLRSIVARSGPPGKQARRRALPTAPTAARPPLTAPWVTVMMNTIEDAGTNFEGSAVTMTVPGKEMKDGEGTIGMTESGTVVVSAAVGVNIETMIGTEGSASLPLDTNLVPHRSACGETGMSTALTHTTVAMTCLMLGVGDQLTAPSALGPPRRPHHAAPCPAYPGQAGQHC